MASIQITAVASLVVILPIILIFFLLQKYFVEGVTLTGVKG